MPAMYPLSDASNTSIFLFTGVSWKRKKILTDIDELDVDTFVFIGTPPPPPDDISHCAHLI